MPIYYVIACLQYLKDLPHKCHQEGYYAGLSRQLDEQKKCHRFSIWGIGGAPGPDARVPTENPYSVRQNASQVYVRYVWVRKENDWRSRGNDEKWELF